ncbi:uncharacterized protein J2S36_001224 [Arcanobacterium hippocoleae]|uniref:Anaerobic sulfatase maturase n=2 Tax=Arcanobacterium hippocoleae TaxID=149017 RepID=A0ABU1T2T9_9ACTO|nr:uncharacterized protein [Arcanobacterium hippocoleae]
MSTATLRVYIQEFLAAHPDGPVTLLWQGGEPTLRGLDFFRCAVDYAKQFARPEQQVSHAIQTNGTLINAEWAEFFRENNFLVGISMDGPANIHDSYRVNRAGRGTHKQVLRGWEILQSAGVETNILCTVHAANQDHPREVYEYFRDVLGARFLQFIPIVERVERKDLAKAEAGWGHGAQLMYQQHGDAVTSRSVNPLRYGKFLREIFDIWVKRDVGTVFVQDFDAALAAVFGTYSVCVHAPGCGNNFAMEFNGDVYACDHWVEPEWKLGNVYRSGFAELAAGQKMQTFQKKKLQQIAEKCRSCDVARFCWGGCPKDRFVGGSFREGNAENYLCAGYQDFYRHIRADVLQMARLVAAGREASEIMKMNLSQESD